MVYRSGCIGLYRGLGFPQIRGTIKRDYRGI